MGPKKLTNTVLRQAAEKRITDGLKRFPIYLILDNIRSVHNVGALFRTADAVGVEKVFLCGITAFPPRPDLDKTACKTTAYVDWEYRKNAYLVIQKLRKRGVQIVVLEQSNRSGDYRTTEYCFPLALVIGNEVDGVNQKNLELADRIIDIPMFGFANSLNVTTAAGVVLYQIIDQLNKYGTVHIKN